MNGLIMDEMIKNLAKVSEAHAKIGELLEKEIEENPVIPDDTTVVFFEMDVNPFGESKNKGNKVVWEAKQGSEEKDIKTKNSVLAGIKERLGAGVFDYENLLNKLLENINKLELVPEFEPELRADIPLGTGYLNDFQDLVSVLEKHNRYFDFLIKHLSKLI